MEKSVVTEKQALSLPDEEMPKSSPKETASIEEAMPTNEPKTKAKKSSKKAKASKPNANKEEILLETKEPQKAKKTTKESPKQAKSIANGGEKQWHPLGNGGGWNISCCMPSGEAPSLLYLFVCHLYYI